MQDIERRQETRRKIQWGGLVKKAGLENEASAVLLGLLLEAAEKLQNSDADNFRSEWKLRGDLVFTYEAQNKKNNKTQL